MKLSEIEEKDDVKIDPSGEFLIDKKGRQWKIIARDQVADFPTFLAVAHLKGNKNVGLFVQGKNDFWLDSIDGPFSTPHMRSEWIKEKDKED